MLYPLDGSNDALAAYGRGPKGADGDVSTAQLTAAIDALKGGVAAPGDTLAELYALIQLRATIAGPVTYTGDHLFPTQAAGNNSQKAASTAYADQGDTNVLAVRQPLDALLTEISTLSTSMSGFILFTGGVASIVTLDTDTGLAANSDTRLATQKAVKTYVDGVSSGLSIKPTVIARTTANVSVSGGGIANGTTHDGVTVTTGQRILVASQSTPSQNGIYLVPASGAATRVPDMDSWLEVPGAFCFVEMGTIYADTAFVCTADDGGTLGTTAITWTQFAGPGTFAAGTGLSLTGTTFAISDAELLAIAGLTSAANKGITFTGAGTAATYDLTAFALTLLDDANQGAMQATLGVVPGTNVQAFDADLAAIAGLTSAANKIPYFTGSATAGLLTLDVDGTLAANSDTVVASQKAVKTYADALIAANDAMVFKGVIDCSANPNYPAADRGHTYKVSVAGKIGGASGTNVEAGDMLLCITDGTAAGTQAAVGANWNIVQANLGTLAAVAVSGSASDLSTGTLAAARMAAFGSGDVSFAAAGGVGTIANDAVTYAKMQNVSATSRLLGRVTAGAGDTEEVVLDTDGTLAANSDTRVASQKAVKTYADALITAIKNGVSAAYDTLAEIATWITAREAAWTPYTPSVAAGGGTFTSASASGGSTATGKTYQVAMSILNTTTGTANTNVRASLPATANRGTGMAGFNITNGKPVIGVVQAADSILVIAASDGTGFPFTGNGQTIVIGGSFEST